VFALVADRGVVVDDIVQVVQEPHSTAMISFTIDAADVAEAKHLSERLTKEIGVQQVVIDDEVAKVSVVGVGMRSHSGVASRLFEAMQRANVNIENISTSEIVISCIVRRSQAEAALRAAHAVFELDRVGSG